MKFRKKLKNIFFGIGLAGLIALVAVLTNISTLYKDNKEYILNLFNSVEPFEENNSFKLLLTPTNFDKEGVFFQILKDRYKELADTTNNESIAVKVANRKAANKTQANILLKEYKADMIIWSDYDDSNSTNRTARFSYILNNSLPSFIPKTGKKYGEIENLIRITEGHLQKDIDDIIYTVLGIKNLRKSNYKESIEYFKRVKKGANKYFYLGLNYHHLDSIKIAESYYQKALEIDPDDASAHINYAHLLYNRGDIEKAESHCQKALEIDPDDAYAHYGYAILLDDRGEIEKAESHYQKALEIDPDFASAHMNYAALLYNRGDIEKAESHYQKALEIDPDFALAHMNYAILLNGRGDIEKAESHYQKALEIDPDFASAHMNYAFLLEARGDIEKAETHYQKALEIDPGDANAHYNYAILLKKVKSNKEAIKHYLKAVELDSSLRSDKANDHFEIN